MHSVKRFLLPIILVPFLAMGQDTGIRFEAASSWKEVLDKAKTENKYIFMDCYASWCGPCKRMSHEIFPQKEVGEYFNAHFINVTVQMDKTPKDTKAIRDWYADASEIAGKYKVLEYPMFLFFSPDGRAVHRVSGATEDGKEFISKAAEALDTDKQYYSLMTQWRNHKGDSSYLLHALTTAIAASDLDHARDIGVEYTESLKDPIRREYIHLFGQYELFTSSKDRSFQLFINNTSTIDKIMDDTTHTYAENSVHGIIFKEEIAPLFEDKKQPLYWNKISARLKQNYPTLGDKLVKMEEVEFQYSIKQEIDGIIYKENALLPSWDHILKGLKDRHPDYDCKRICLKEKTTYYARKKLWTECNNAAYALMRQYGPMLGGYEMNNLAWYNVFQHSNDQKIIGEALKWMKLLIENAPIDDEKYDTYANLLYKAGRKDEAIVWEKKAIEIASRGDVQGLKDFKANLEKMERKEKTWEDDTAVK